MADPPELRTLLAELTQAKDLLQQRLTAEQAAVSKALAENKRECARQLICATQNMHTRAILAMRAER